jgi:hypothetical protein
MCWNLLFDLDNKFQHIPAQHRISGSTRVAEFNSFAGPGNFAKHLTELLFQSFLLKSVSVGFILTMVTRGTTTKSGCNLVLEKMLGADLVEFLV